MPRLVTLLYVRHGQSTNNAGTSDGGHAPDAGVTPRGRSQALAVARHLARAHRGQIAAIYCSPFRRALQTAAAISAALELPVRVEVPLHELWGQYAYEEDGTIRQHPGLNRTEMLAIAPGAQLGEGITNEGWWFGSWPGEERAMAGMGENAGRFVDRLLDGHETTVPPRDLVCAVGHGGSGDALIKRLAGGAHTFGAWFELDNASLSQIRWYRTDAGERRAVVDYLNRVDHLPRRLQTPNYQNKF